MWQKHSSRFQLLEDCGPVCHAYAIDARGVQTALIFWGPTEGKDRLC